VTRVGGNTITGSGPLGAVGGIGQNIEIAGNGNTVVNATGVAVVTNRPEFAPLPNGAQSCSCITMPPAGVSLSVAPTGAVANIASQFIGSGAILQNASVTTDFNHIVNSFQLQVQVLTSGSGYVKGWQAESTDGCKFGAAEPKIYEGHRANGVSI